jgi:hypothetical protein
MGANMGKKISKESLVVKANESAFQAVLDLIAAARRHAEQAINAAVIDLYWSVGEYLSHKIAEDGWGKGTVGLLSE